MREILVDPVEIEVKEIAERLDINLADLSLKVLLKETPSFLKDWKTMLVAVQARSRVDEDTEL